MSCHDTSRWLAGTSSRKPTARRRWDSRFLPAEYQSFARSIAAQADAGPPPTNVVRRSSSSAANNRGTEDRWWPETKDLLRAAGSSPSAATPDPRDSRARRVPWRETRSTDPWSRAGPRRDSARTQDLRVYEN